MYARAIDEADARLRELRHEEWGDLGLAAFAVGAAIVATEFLPALTAPLFVGGLVVGALGVRALWRRWDLVELLAGERDAYVISEVLACASREATMERRYSFAALIRHRCRDASVTCDARVLAVADQGREAASPLHRGFARGMGEDLGDHVRVAFPREALDQIPTPPQGSDAQGPDGQASDEERRREGREDLGRDN